MEFQVIGQCGGCSQVLAEEVGTPLVDVARGGGLLAMCDACDFYREEIEKLGLPFALELLQATHAHEEALFAVGGELNFVTAYEQKVMRAEWNTDGRLVALHAVDAEYLAAKGSV